MNKYETLVIGGGFAGLIAALCSVSNKKHTGMIAKGAGSLTIGGGVVDVLGYDVRRRPVHKPLESLSELPEEHPYSLLGVDKVRESLNFFKRFTAETGYPYSCYEDERNSWIVTPIGKLKPTFLRPPCSDPEVLEEKHLVVIGVTGLKDASPQLIVKGLKKLAGFSDRLYNVRYLDSPYREGRDLSVFDIANFTNRKEGKQWLLREMKKAVPTGCSVIMPPILGIEQALNLKKLLKEELSINVSETLEIPPSVTGIRLRKLLMEKIKAYGGELIETAEVTSASVERGRCQAVFTEEGGKKRRYEAENFIVATGGFFGGGQASEPGKAYERIFGIDLEVPAEQMSWSNKTLLGNERHLFGSMGVKVNKDLLPLDKTGAPLLENVRFVGRALGGYDFVYEKSGNGVALATAYYAGNI